VARLLAKTIAAEQQVGWLDAASITLDDAPGSDDCALTCRPAGNSRLGFVSRVWLASIGATHFVYDFVGMARAHCNILGMTTPYLTYLHGIEVWEGTSANRLRAARRARTLVVNSSYTRDRAERAHGGFLHSRVCWLATESDTPAVVLPTDETLNRVLIVSRIDSEQYKGHDKLIACWPNVVASIPNARLIIAGGGCRLDMICHLARQSPVARNIDVLGFVSEAMLENEFLHCDIFCMPSRGEGFGLVYIEAMRCGKPVVASIHDAAPEINLDGITGYNVNLDYSDELPDRIISLLKNKDCAKKMGENGRRRWAEHFCFSAFKKRFTPILREFLTLEKT
jgi:phosphatidyl-myo-inositol dimannoside synthase